MLQIPFIHSAVSWTPGGRLEGNQKTPSLLPSRCSAWPRSFPASGIYFQIFVYQFEVERRILECVCFIIVISLSTGGQASRSVCVLIVKISTPFDQLQKQATVS
ncbi:unnamed protein product [Calypogeia fissa]